LVVVLLMMAILTGVRWNLSVSKHYFNWVEQTLYHLSYFLDRVWHFLPRARLGL
jgi:hypothetical protein